VSDSRPLRIGIVAGEESGDLLGADLVAALSRRTGRPVELVGVGGRHLAATAPKSL
jgi:lipid-A-disaccharide synthase